MKAKMVCPRGETLILNAAEDKNVALAKWKLLETLARAVSVG